MTPPVRHHQRFARQEFASVGLDTAALARKFAAEQLDHWHVPEPTIADAVQIVSELVANAAEHSSGHVQVALNRDEYVLTVTVTDEGESESAPHVLKPTEEAESGRGLFLVAVLAKTWGWYPQLDGTVVWAQVRLRPAARPADGC
ncbi:ATP-binding protein [Streptomyces niveus]|uniref:ATP-binding protein n=1 Tax=Streptomyces niveus TaxID=193462 RepID=UPI0037188DF7